MKFLISIILENAVGREKDVQSLVQTCGILLRYPVLFHLVNKRPDNLSILREIGDVIVPGAGN